MGYQRHAIIGFSVQSLQKVFVFVINFVKIVVLARLLKPSDFGLFSLVMIALGLTESFTQTGINTTIVQSKKDINYFLDCLGDCYFSWLNHWLNYVAISLIFEQFLSRSIIVTADQGSSLGANY